MANEILNFKGLRCPQPVIKFAIKAQGMKPGTTVDVQADCPEFPNQIKDWCNQTGHVMINIVTVGALHTATIRI